MYKATDGIVLPTSIIGSLPRPHWYTENLGARDFRTAMVDARFREQYTDAVSAYIRDQETAGLDIFTDGDARLRRRRRRAQLVRLSGQAHGGLRRRRLGRFSERARRNPARSAGSADHARPRRPGRARRTAICGDVEDRPAADRQAGQVRAPSRRNCWHSRCAISTTRTFASASWRSPMPCARS